MENTNSTETTNGTKKKPMGCLIFFCAIAIFVVGIIVYNIVKFPITEGKIINNAKNSISQYGLSDATFNLNLYNKDGNYWNYDLLIESSLYDSLDKSKQLDILKSLSVTDISTFEYGIFFMVKATVKSNGNSYTYLDGKLEKNLEDYYIAGANDNSTSTMSVSENKDIIDKIVKLFEDDTRWLEDGRSRGKYIEDLLKQYPKDIEINTFYDYDAALMYMDVDELEDAKTWMGKIDPAYSGAYSETILKKGLELFGSKDTWQAKYQIEVGVSQRTNDRANSTDKSFEISVIQFMNDQYEYYDKQEGKYCGDKYTDTIVKAAADKFNITTEEVLNIWNDSSLQQMATNNTSSNSSDDSSSLPSNAISLHFNGSVILCAVSQDDYSQAINYIVNKDEAGLNNMISSGFVFDVPSNTKAVLQQAGIGSAKVRLLEGAYKDQIVWVASEAVAGK